jgi:hypothetical protein
LTTLPQDTTEESAVYPRAVDLDWLRKTIAIETVAVLLDLEVKDHYARCFRPDNHQNGDANPSLHFHKNRAFCFICDRRALSNIDLVMAVLGCDFRKAVGWFRREFGSLPLLRGRPAGLTRERPFRVGTGGDLEDVVRSGLYATLSNPARSILQVIQELRETKGAARVPYKSLMRYAGVGSKSTIKAALDELAGIHLLDIHKTHRGSIEPHNVYCLTPHDPELRKLIQEAYDRNRDAIAAECDYYRETKLARRRKKSGPPPLPLAPL